MGGVRVHAQLQQLRGRGGGDGEAGGRKAGALLLLRGRGGDGGEAGGRKAGALLLLLLLPSDRDAGAGGLKRGRVDGGGGGGSGG